jgi:acyl carrier protein
MDNSEAMSRVTVVFQRVFGDETLSLTRDTTAKDVEGWDSLMHINLVVAIESEFKIRFTSREIARLQNVGELIDLIVRKQGVSS